MSQAVIDFCEGLKSTLLALEDRLDKAKANLATGAAHVSDDAKRHVDEAVAQLVAFKVHAANLAQAIRSDLPLQTAGMKETLTGFGQEAQVAMRHAVVFLAEQAAKGAEGAGEALKSSAKTAQKVADDFRGDTAVTTVEPEAGKPPT
jgi:hypothetical protein